ncbi:LysR family transcriptional regulator [Streptomyces spectabilis]|nr:LysR family transcriptional regulator [Streptomyces spectabilis]MBB5102283.1 DNA-binding transcriptional LysR family regulator [Streptomyces spectabilis]MCI3907331.1 LysR family transcriptional regulator [Streptomyces spectabilis]GGV29872.1 LysR family transcriptional regulator [Streptomyces spectabilis]
MNPWRLRLLTQLDTLGTVRAVAQAANLSPSSVSQQLAVLESETRTQLIERTGRRVRLTSAGLILARRARAILDHMDSVEAELRGFGEEPAGLVRLGVFQSAIHTMAVPAVTRLAREHPHLDVEVLQLEPHESMPALRGGDADLIITTTDFDELPLGPDLDLVPLATDSILLVVDPGHPAAGRGAVDLASLADEAWAFDMPQSYMANLALRLCRQARFEPRVVCRFSNYMMALQHVEAGLSIALLPGLAVDRRYRVATSELATPVTRTITAAVRRGAPPRAGVRAVLDALRQPPDASLPAGTRPHRAQDVGSGGVGPS